MQRLSVIGYGCVLGTKVKTQRSKQAWGRLMIGRDDLPAGHF